jgi:Ca2+/Na+ antiporter
MMSLGTGLVILLSDPMVDVLSNIGARTGVPPFYIAFVFAPLASNTSELIASLNYAKKKTGKTITIALSTLEGAACMNNTFCLAIFMGARAPPSPPTPSSPGLAAFNKLAWHFTAETSAILLMEFLITAHRSVPPNRVDS